MVTWEYFKKRRRINVSAMIKKHNLGTYNEFCAHLKKIEVQSPIDDSVKREFYKPVRKRPAPTKEKLGIKKGVRAGSTRKAISKAQKTQKVATEPET